MDCSYTILELGEVTAPDTMGQWGRNTTAAFSSKNSCLALEGQGTGDDIRFTSQLCFFSVRLRSTTPQMNSTSKHACSSTRTLWGLMTT